MNTAVGERNGTCGEKKQNVRREDNTTEKDENTWRMNTRDDEEIYMGKEGRGKNENNEKITDEDVTGRENVNENEEQKTNETVNEETGEKGREKIKGETCTKTNEEKGENEGNDN